MTSSNHNHRPAKHFTRVFVGLALLLLIGAIGCGGPAGPVAPPVDLSRYEVLQGSQAEQEAPSLERGVEGVDSYGEEEAAY